MNNVPFISIVIPFYNYASYIPQLCASLDEQRLKDFEVIFVNDGSTDDSAERLNELSCRYDFPVLVKHQANQGRGVACKVGALMARGKFLLFLDADDELLPNAIEAFRLAVWDKAGYDVYFANHETCDLPARKKIKVSSNPSLFNEPARNLKSFLFDKRYSFANGSYILKKSIFDDIYYDLDLRISEDIPFKAHLLLHKRCVCIKPVVLRVHRHKNSMRSNTAVYAEQRELLADRVFNPAKVPNTIRMMKEKYEMRLALSLFRMHAINHEFDLALSVYKEVFSQHPIMALRFRYLKRFIKSWLGSFRAKYLRRII